jgi:hypothetical protein
MRRTGLEGQRGAMTNTTSNSTPPGVPAPPPTASPAEAVTSTTDWLTRAAVNLFGPVNAPDRSTRQRLLQARRVCAAVGALATLLQVVVWLLIAVVTGRVDSPWWLWTAAPAALLTLSLGLTDRAVRYIEDTR